MQKWHTPKEAKKDHPKPNQGRHQQSLKQLVVANPLFAKLFHNYFLSMTSQCLAHQPHPTLLHTKSMLLSHSTSSLLYLIWKEQNNLIIHTHFYFLLFIFLIYFFQISPVFHLNGCLCTPLQKLFFGFFMYTIIF